MNLFDIKEPNDIKKLNLKELKKLANEIREFLIEEIPKTGGHLSSNLGVIELTLALHYVFDSPKDGLIFDVGHQSYTHKILTGRAKYFNTLRQTEGLSGYMNYKESNHDIWESGHAGTSLSALYGFLYSKLLKQEEGLGIAVIGDASITNGTAFEALNLLGSDEKIKGVIVLNDNEMGISKSVGSISKALTKVRFNKFYIKMMRLLHRILPNFMIGFFSRIKRSLKSFFQQRNIFEDLGFFYIGPVDGHDLKGLIYQFERIKRAKKSVVIHVLTNKGKGLVEAEQDITGTYHGISKPNKVEGISWSEGIHNIIYELHQELKIFVIMPAMTLGTKFSKFQRDFKDYYIDVGIAEEHAAVMSSMLARQDIKVFLPLYATFSQRAFDQILNDIARSNTHVVFGIDRSGIVGDDGSTHQGLFDVSMFALMPNTTILMPYDLSEAYALLKYAYTKTKGPVALRYPREMTINEINKTEEVIAVSWTSLKKGSKLALISYGPVLERMLDIASHFENASVVNARFIKPIDEAFVLELFKTHDKIFIYEEVAAQAGIYPKILHLKELHNYQGKIITKNINEKVVEHGSYESVIKKLNLDNKSICDEIRSLFGEK